MVYLYEGTLVCNHWWLSSIKWLSNIWHWCDFCRFVCESL